MNFLVGGSFFFVFTSAAVFTLGPYLFPPCFFPILWDFVKNVFFGTCDKPAITVPALYLFKKDLHW